LYLLAAATDGHFFWITSRAAGTAALIFSSLSVGAGLMMGGRLLKRRGPDLRVTHEALSLATIVALVVHGLTLLGDGFLKPNLADITIPFASGYKAPWMAIGIVAGWLMVILGVSYYARARIGVERWRRLHRFTALAWVMGIVHSLGTGTDAGQRWFLAAAGIVVVPAMALLLVRLSGLSASPRRVPTQTVEAG
jgi:methionine sulfoxide reductase heme-binding subunit